MGAELKFVRGDGPTFPDPVRTREDLGRLREPDVHETLGYVFEALRLVRRELEGRVPVLGFAGTPWTLAAYLVEGGGSKHFAHLLTWSYRDPEGLAGLLDKIADVSIAYLEGQLEAGAQALQLFDTWGGLLSVERWNALARPPLEKILRALQGRAPLTYFVQGASHLLPAASELPVDVLSVDWRQPLSEVRTLAGEKVLQGNLDPAALLGPPEEIRKATERVLDQGRGGGHIVNLGHGILPGTPVENVRAVVEHVHESTARREMGSGGLNRGGNAVE